MFENVSYKKKFIALLALMVMLGVTAYKRSFRITMDAAVVLDESREKLARVSNSQQKKNTELVKLEEIHKASDEYFNIYTNRLILTGAYGDLLNTTYNYEKKFEFSRVVSLRFYVEKEARTRKTRLFEQIIFQNYEKIR